MTAEVAIVFYGVGAFAIGCITGLAEVLPRYRDDPMKAARCRAGVVYWLLNGIVSLTVFWAVILYAPASLHLQPGALIAHSDWIKAMLLAGFGAMAVVRAKIFKATLSNGQEISVGPEHVINVLFETANSYIAKSRALERTKLVERIFSRLDFTKLRYRVFTLALIARQSLSPEDQRALGDAVGKIDADSTLPMPEKSLRVGYLLLDYVGEAFLRDYKFPDDWIMPTAPVPAVGVAAVPPEVDEEEIHPS
jgi:hypothetical protein